MLEDDIIVLASIAAVALAFCMLLTFTYILLQGTSTC